jgi:hypothetical protein
MTVRLRVTTALVLVHLALPASLQAQLWDSPDTAALMRKVGIYSNWFVNRFSNVVSEEAYEQRFSVASRRRQLRSDFMLVGYPGSTAALMTFRDIREVDGKPLTGQEDRIARLFLEPFESAVRRAQEIHRDGLRYSIDNGRLMDPLTVIGYLQPAYQRNFRFSRGGMAKSLGPTIREVSLTPIERDRSKALLKPARAWVAEDTGAVVKTELRSGFGVRSEITTTTFSMDPVLQMPVPIEMRDEVPRGRDDFIGVAKYSKFRRFTVRTDEAVDIPPAQP